MAMKRNADVYRDSWKPLLESSESTRQQPAIRRKEKWVHENKELLFGSILYRGKYLGTVDSGTTSDFKQLVRKSVRELLVQKGKTPEVEIAISVRSIIVTEIKTKMHVCKQKLQKIAYCSEDRSISDKILAFIVKKAESQLQCFCFETHSPASRITLTVGQAFQLAYERSQEAKEASEMFAKEMKKLKATKGKEDFAKKLVGMMSNPDTTLDPAIEDDFLPEMNFKSAQQAKKTGKKMSELFESWQQLNDTLKPLRDEDELPSFTASTDKDIDTALAQIERDLREWSNARNPYQANDVAVTDALKELDNVLGSDSLTGLDSQTKLTEEESTAL